MDGWTDDDEATVDDECALKSDRPSSARTASNWGIDSDYRTRCYVMAECTVYF